ncbi:cell envelope biogenesis protein TolA [Phaeovulum sp.]|uniref:cell envelope biogenesis protein TolA n=1 Tax=Phaeovulum sp. TaxID=2934796 RepID=UPI0039E3ED76
MNRADKIGTGISAGLHLGLIVWVAFGGYWFKPKAHDPVQMTEVAVMSQSQFDAMVAAAPKASDQPAAEMVMPEAPAEVAPAPTPEPEVTQPPQAEALPTPEPTPEPQPDLTDLTTPPVADVTDTPPIQPMPPVEEPSQTVLTQISPRPKPKPAPRVAPTPAEAPAPDARVSDTAMTETKPEETPDPAPVVEPPKEEAAPPETTTEIVTEATETTDKPESSAPATSARPKARPKKPAPADKPTETAKPAQPAKPQSDSVNDALAEALAGDPAPSQAEGSGGVGRAASGPPMTSGEKDALIVDVKACWNVGALSTEALRTVVTLSVKMNPDGTPDINSIRQIGYEGGSEASAKQAYEAGRRAIVRCGSDGFPLPADKYDQWREIEIVFNPEKMRMK